MGFLLSGLHEDKNAVYHISRKKYNTVTPLTGNLEEMKQIYNHSRGQRREQTWSKEKSWNLLKGFITNSPLRATAKAKASWNKSFLFLSIPMLSYFSHITFYHTLFAYQGCVWRSSVNYTSYTSRQATSARVPMTWRPTSRSRLMARQG